MTMRMTAVSASPAAANYLLRDMGCEDHLDSEQEALDRAAEQGDAAAYYARATRDGESPGRWTGHHLEALGLIEGEHVDQDGARALLAELRNPTTGEQLGQRPASTSGVLDRFREWVAENPDATEEERRAEFNYLVDQKRTTTGFYDMTYSAPKSVSVYHQALVQAGRHDEAAAVLRAHRDAVEAANESVQEHTYTRVWDADRGTQVYEHVGKMAAIDFDHSTSREQDPHLHTHTAVINRVQGHDGKWRAVASKAWKPVKAELAEVYERTLAERIEQTTGARMVLRADGMGREIAGVSSEVLESSSTRTRQVEEHQAEAEKRFKAEHGRSPTQKERGRLHRRSGLETRAAKTKRTPDEQLKSWGERINTKSVAAAVAAAGQDIDLNGRPDAEAMVAITGAESRQRAIRQAIATCQERSATFSPGEVYAALSKVVSPDGRPAGEMCKLLGELRTEALTDPSYGVLDISRPEPVEIGWWREESTGLAIWRDPGDKGVLTTRTQLSTEKSVVKTARQRRRTGRPLGAEELREAEEGLTEAGLSDDQRRLVMSVLSSERVSDAVAAPAGTGKSFAMGQLAAVWERRGGVVLGLATSQRAAEVLAEDGINALNTSAFLRQFEPEDGQPPRQRLDSGTLVVLDEASMSSTNEVARVQHLVHQAGAKMVYTGDPSQLQAVGAGGAFGLVAAENGAVELEQVWRFRNEWERDASLHLRDGRVEAVDEYTEHGRVAMGTAEEMRQRAAEAYVADVTDGSSSLLIAATHAEAAQAASQVQGLLQATGRLGSEEVATLGDGNRVHRGDLVMATRNNRSCATEGLAQVTNKGRYVVRGTWDGGVVVAAEDGSGTAWLPHDYVAEHVQLGYAGTEHAAQGVTVDRGHTLTAGYVGMTRGRESNNAWLTTYAAADAEDPGLHRSARDAFAERLVEGDGSAVSTMRREIDAANSSGELLRIWEHMSRETALDRHRDMIMHHMGTDQAERIEHNQGAAGFYDILRRAELGGHNIDQLLPRVINEKSFDRVGDLAAVLTQRVSQHVDDPETTGWSWSSSTAGGAGRLSEQHQEVAALLDAREARLGREVLDARPQWAVDALGAAPTDAREQEEWKRRAGTLAAWREIAGVTREDTGLGRAPDEADWLRRTAWLRAARAVEAEPERIEVRSADEHDLRAWIASAERENAWAPEYVAEDLGRARSLASRYADEAVVERERAAAARDEQQREQHQTAAEEAEQRRMVLTHRADALAEIDAVRRQWVVSTEAMRSRARAAREELAKREHEESLEAPAREQRQEAEQVGLWSAKRLLPMYTPQEHADQAQQLQETYAEQTARRELLVAVHGDDEGQRRWDEQQESARREQAQRELAGVAPAAEEPAGPERVPVSEQARVTEHQDQAEEAEDPQMEMIPLAEVTTSGHRHQAEADAVHVSEDILDSGAQADRAEQIVRPLGEAQRAAWATQQHVQARQQRREQQQEEMRQYEQEQAQQQADQHQEAEQML